MNFIEEINNNIIHSTIQSTIIQSTIIQSIMQENSQILIIILISLLLILCHFIFSYKKKFSVYYNTFKHMLQPNTNIKPLKIVVFDLDETLGYFTELGIFWDSLEQYYGHNLFKDKLFEVMDLFQEFIRPNIIKILEYVKEKKQNNQCDHVMIYTNNQGPKSWVKMLSEYFNNRLDYELFDKIIAAFKVRNKVIEMCRTSHEKSVDDLIRCTKIPPNAEICFIDDQYHSLMEQDNVYYINVKPYTYNLPFEEMAERYFNRYIQDDDNKDKFIKFIVTNMKKYNFIVKQKSDIEQSADGVVGKQLLIHLENFFKKGRTKNTRKKKTHAKHSNTRKKNMFI
jgi:hypothetical protein